MIRRSAADCAEMLKVMAGSDPGDPSSIPGVTADTHSHVMTGHEGSKFGLPPKEAADLIRRIEHSPRLTMLGPHVSLSAGSGTCFAYYGYGPRDGRLTPRAGRAAPDWPTRAGTSGPGRRAAARIRG